jgi:hypothetical protein
MSDENPTHDEIVAKGRAFDKKVRDTFAEVIGDRANVLAGHTFSEEICERIYNALKSTGTDEKIARDTAFHLTDINSDVAFLMAIYLFPERFTSDEIDYGIGALIVHMPNHLFAAAKINGFPAEDIFSDPET